MRTLQCKLDMRANLKRWSCHNYYEKRAFVFCSVCSLKDHFAWYGQQSLRNHLHVFSAQRKFRQRLLVESQSDNKLCQIYLPADNNLNTCLLCDVGQN